MVRVHKMSSDFDIADVRESFMRQFQTHQNSLNLVVDTQDNDHQVSSCLKAAHLHLIKSPTHETRSGGVVEKKSGIFTIVRWGCDSISASPLLAK